MTSPCHARCLLAEQALHVQCARAIDNSQAMFVIYLIAAFGCVALRVFAVNVRTAGDIARALRQAGSSDVLLTLIGNANTCEYHTCMYDCHVSQQSRARSSCTVARMTARSQCLWHALCPAASGRRWHMSTPNKDTFRLHYHFCGGLTTALTAFCKAHPHGPEASLL